MTNSLIPFLRTIRHITQNCLTINGDPVILIIHSTTGFFMNERIKKLANEAAKYSAVMSLPTGESGDQLFVEKFAELIVRDCVQTLIDNTPERYTNEAAEEDWDKGYDRAMKDCVHHIQEHFGVEE